MRSIQQKTSHWVWECKYHIVWIPKYRKKVLYKELRQYLGEIFKNLAKQKVWEERRILQDKVFGQEDIMCQLLEEMKI